MTAPIQLFDTASRQKKIFRTITPGKVGLYTCGPTVYHYAHIGNLRTYVFEDLLVRILKRAGYQVQHVMNITDVGHLASDADDGEDKMESGSRREGKTAWEIADFYTKAFFDDFQALHCLSPQTTPKATDHITEMIELIMVLEQKGYTYETEDGIYYDTSKFPRYANFAKLDVENLQAGSRVEMGGKKSPTDFALWKFSPSNTKRQMEWDSPWGKGFPGWHIECSAMSMKYLGETFDIHCGGKDHIPVHHTNEIAQSEACTDKVFAHYWLHGEFLTEKSGKMSKSKGEFLTISLLKEKGFRPMDYRFLLLQAHYRTELQFDWDSLESARAGFEGILNRLADWEGVNAIAPQSSTNAKKFVDAFEKAIFDDLNLPQATAVLFDVLKDASLTPGEKIGLMDDFDGVFGLNFSEEYLARRKADLPPEVEALRKARDEARTSKNWKESDRLRDSIQALGYTVEDTARGTRVHKK